MNKRCYKKKRIFGALRESAGRSDLILKRRNIMLQQVFAFLLAVLTLLSGKVAPVLGSTDAEPIVAAQRDYRFDQDAFLLGAYCFRVDEHFEETRAWIKEAGLQFTVAGSAFIFTNMYEPDTGKEASFTVSFPGAKRITVYRMGEKTVIDGSTMTLTLENREGVFVTVEG